MGYATLKRILTKLISENLVIPVGTGRARKYVISPAYNLFYPVDLIEYFKNEIDEREILNGFNFSLIRDVLSTVKLFTEAEHKHLTRLQHKYTDNVSQLSDSEYLKELERLAIDLSWKSSQI